MSLVPTQQTHLTMARSFLPRTSFTSTLVVLLSIATIVFMSTVIVTVNSAPAVDVSNSTLEPSASDLDESSIDHDEPASPPAGVFVSPWSNGRSNVRVGLPFIFGMDLDRSRDRSTGNQTRLDLGVLGGMVRVSMDRSRNSDGTKSGPVVVTVFGHPITVG